VAASGGFVRENPGSCPGCESGYEGCFSARRLCGAALTQRAEAGRCPDASAGYQATPPASKRKD